jgi:small subunit ribosomal protein S5
MAYNRGNFISNRSNQPVEASDFYEKVVQVNRVSKKTKGGDKRSLSVIVVAGDKNGKVGVGLGKASDVAGAVKKATVYAKKHLLEVPLKGRTIPHSVLIKLGAARVLLKPAPVGGTGVIAGGAVRVVVEAAGIHDVVSKILGTKNKASNVYATLEALKQLKKVNQLTSGSANQEKTEGKPNKKTRKEKAN